MTFSEKKAAHVAAFFLERGGGSLNVMKLMKLMYLAERGSLAEYGEPLTGDRLCSMEYGPILSRTLNFINGFVASSADDGWEVWVTDRAGHQLALNRSVGDIRSDLGSLSDADLHVLERVWNEYGHMTQFELSDLTHEKCDEWEDPDGSSKDITYFRLLKCVGFDTEVAREIEQRIKAQNQSEAVLAGL